MGRVSPSSLARIQLSETRVAEGAGLTGEIEQRAAFLIEGPTRPPVGDLHAHHIS